MTSRSKIAVRRDDLSLAEELRLEYRRDGEEASAVEESEAEDRYFGRCAEDDGREP